MKLFRKLLPVLRFVIVSFIIIFLLWVLLQKWFYLYEPLPGIWQYSDGDLEITVYITDDGGIIDSSGAFLKCEAEFSYKGDNRKAVFLYNIKMYQCRLVAIDDYVDILILSFSYRTPIKKGELELTNIEISKPFEELLKDYKVKTLILKRIGKYIEPK